MAETKIQRGIFQGDALSPQLFIMAMMPLNHILRKCTAGYKLSRSQEKINHLMYMDYYYYYYSLEFFTSVLADGFSLEFERQQVSSSLQDSSQYSGRPQ